MADEWDIDEILDEAEEQGAWVDTLAPEGRHIMQITYAGSTVTTTGKIGIRFKGVIASGEQDAGASAWGGMYWEDNDKQAFARAANQLLAAGVPKKKISAAMRNADPDQYAEVLAPLLEETYVSVRVKHEEWEGTVNGKIGFLNAVPSTWTPPETRKNGPVPPAPDYSAEPPF